MPKPLTDWQKAYNHAKTGQTVRLTVNDVLTPGGEDFAVYLVDAHKEYLIAWAAFHPNKPAKATNFAFNLSFALLKLDKPPSDEAKIVLKADNVEVTFSKVEISLPGSE